MPMLLAASPESSPEAFWQRAPKSGPHSVALFGFDGNASADDAINTLEDVLTLEEDDTGLPSFGTSDAPQAEYKLEGGAALVETGRWNGGVHLSAKSSVRISPVRLDELFGDAVTIDLWIRPDETKGDAATLLSTKPSGGLQLTRDADGRLSLMHGDVKLLTHPRKAPANTWTHVAVRSSASRGERSLELLVDGLAASATGTEKLGAARTFAGHALVLGSVDSRTAGFVGHVDALRVSRRAMPFYALVHEPFIDRAASRTLVSGPPYFARPLEPTLSLSFDNTLEPNAFTGARWEGRDIDARFADGMRGPAVVASSLREGVLAFRGSKAVSPANGTLEVWIQPTNWDNHFVGDFLGTNVPSFRALSTGAPDEPRHQQGGLNLRQGRSGQQANAAYTRLQPGTWTHVVIVWQGHRTRGVYLNGEPQLLNQASLRFSDAVRQAGKGDGDDAIELRITPTGTLIDELSIYDRPLNPMEVRNLHARYYPDAESRLEALPLIAPTFAYQHYDDRLHVRVSCLPVKGVNPIQFEVRMFDAEGQPRFESDRLSLNADGTGSLTVPQRFEFSEHSFVITTQDGEGKELARLASKWTREKPVWWRNDIGITRDVPDPWTPIEASGRTIDVWGRTVTLAPSGLPAAIRAVEGELLDAPATVEATVAGKSAVLKGTGVTWTEQAGDVTRWTAATASDVLQADVVGSIEFDGMMQYAVTLRPKDGKQVTVDRLTVEFPMPRDNAFQLIANSGGRNFRAAYDVRMVPQGEGRVWDTMRSKPRIHRGVRVGNFMPIIWLGGDHRGICFFSENDKGWTPDNELASQEVYRRGDTIVYRMNVISKPVTIETERTFTFVVLPTPTKPLAKNWRTFNHGVSYDVVDDFSGMPMTEPAEGAGTSLSFALEPHSWEDAAVWHQRLREKFPEPAPVLKYIDASWPKLGPSMNEYRYSLWNGIGRMTWSREVEDYYVWIMHEYVKRGLIDGLYIDDVSMSATMATYATAYELPDGTIQPGFNTLGLRRFFKRMWVVLQQHDKQPHIVPHMTWCFELPAFSFIESGLNGEDRVIPPNSTPTFIDKWRRDEIRIMSNGTKFGFVTLWIPEIKNEGFSVRQLNRWIHTQARAMHALAVQHDLWYMFGWPTPGIVGRDMEAFGIADPKVRFIGHWDAADHIKLTGEHTQAAFWVRGNRVLTMVSNFTREEQDVSLTVDAAELLGLNGSARVTWHHVDSTFEPPATKTASKAEIRAAEKSLSDISLDDEDEGLGMTFELDDPDRKRREKYAIKPDGNTVRMLVRPHDYRLLELRVEPE